MNKFMFDVFRHALIFGLGPVLQKSASLILLPLYTHHLSPADYGEIELLTLFIGLFVVIFSLEYRQGYIRALIKAEETGEDGLILSVSLVLFLALAALGSLGFALLLPLYCKFMLGYGIGWEYGAVLLVGLFADIVNFLLAATAQARLWSARMVSLGLLQFVLGTGLSVYLVVGQEMGPIGLFLGHAFGSVLFMGALLFMLRNELSTPKKIRDTVWPILIFSYPLLIGALFYFVLRQVDRLVISDFLSLDELGVYSMGWKLSGLLLTFVFLPFVRSFDVWRYRFYEEGDRADDVATISRVFLLGISTAALILATFGADIFILLANPRFMDAMKLLPILNAAILLQCCYTIISSAFFVSGETKQWLRILAFGAVIQVGGSIILVQIIGIFGAAISMTCANFAIYIVSSRLAPQYWEVPYQHGKIISVIVIVSVLSYLRGFWPREDILMGFAINFALFGIFILGIFVIGAVSLDDFKKAKALIEAKIKDFPKRLYIFLFSKR
jgi:O-antigen/teichoic acid export membrane protein